MMQELRRFLYKGSLFAIPFALHALTTVIVDPFDRIGVSYIVPDEVKLRTSFIINWTLWKLVKYERAPLPRILLGDSRMELFDPRMLDEQGLHGFANLAYGGGTLQEAVATFWIASKRTRLTDVVIGLNLFNYNGSGQLYDRVPEAEKIANDPIAYLYDRTVLRALGYNLAGLWDRNVELDRRPPMSRDEFWRRQLDITGTSFYEKYTYPKDGHDALVALGDYCRRNGIRLRFVIFPTHQELQSLIGKFGLVEANARFRADLQAIAPVVDLDWPSELTADRANFDDPFHFTRRVATSLVKPIFGEPE